MKRLSETYNGSGIWIGKEGEDDYASDDGEESMDEEFEPESDSDWNSETLANEVESEEEIENKSDGSFVKAVQFSAGGGRFGALSLADAVEDNDSE